MQDGDNLWGDINLYADEGLKNARHIVSDNIINSLLIPQNNYKNLIFFSQGIDLNQRLHFNTDFQSTHLNANNLLWSSCLNILNNLFDCLESDSVSVIISLAQQFVKNLAIDINQPYIVDLLPDDKKKKIEHIIANKCKLNSIDELISMFIKSGWKIYGKNTITEDKNIDEVSQFSEEIVPVCNQNNIDMLTLTDDILDLLPDSSHGTEFTDNESCFESGPPSKIAKLNLF